MVALFYKDNILGVVMKFLEMIFTALSLSVDHMTWGAEPVEAFHIALAEAAND